MPAALLASLTSGLLTCRLLTRGRVVGVTWGAAPAERIAIQSGTPFWNKMGVGIRKEMVQSIKINVRKCYIDLGAVYSVLQNLLQLRHLISSSCTQ